MEIVLATEKHEGEETTISEITNTVTSIGFQACFAKEIMKPAL